MTTVTYQQPADVRTESGDVTLKSGVGAGFKHWDNPENLMDYETSHVMETVINVVFLTAVVIVGVIGNVVNMLVFAKQGLQDRINVCLFSLALADCGYVIALFIYRSYSLLAFLSTEVGAYWKIRSLNTIFGVFWGFSAVSNLLTLLVSVERCLCVVSPLRARQLLKTKVMVILIVLIYFFSLSSSLIFNAKYTVGTITDSNSNTTRYRAVFSDFYLHNKVFVDIVYNYVLAIAFPFTSLVVVVVSTITTVIFLRRALSWKRKSANVDDAVDKKEAAVTKMLLLVCYAYVIFVTPSVVNAFVVQFVNGWRPTGRYSNTFYVYVALMRLLTALNSSLNFFIYFFRGSKFRSTIRELFCGKKQKQIQISRFEEKQRESRPNCW
ncbi:uncharacterized protein LOC143285253 [Babylonia areolata]|uniref:uncharacterized protein LOC143285253 n=1 Tax=Babylonia areolata TaxID=304850 RepID=UPI003FD54F4E